MACPLFLPSVSLGDLVSVPVPLGDIYGGNCAADPSAVIEPDTLRRYCNFGYARGHCERAAQADADAVRSLVRAEHGSVVEIAWAVERDHHPIAVGVVEVETAANHVPANHAPANYAPLDDMIARHARACAMAYIRQTQSRPAAAGRITVAAHP